MDSQTEHELVVFRHFAEVASLPVLPESIRKCDPPAPDIVCELISGETRAFELVEVCNPTNARFASSGHSLGLTLDRTFEGLQPSVRAAFKARFGPRPLCFYFRPDATMNRIRNLLPSLLSELIEMPEVDNAFQGFSADPSSRVVERVRYAGKLKDPDGPNFSIGGFFDPETDVLGTISAKLVQDYVSDAPIDLLAHFGAFAWSKNTGYHTLLSELLSQRGLGPFSRIWVLEWEGIGFVFPPVL